jgi:hypothetical protein
MSILSKISLVFASCLAISVAYVAVSFMMEKPVVVYVDRTPATSLNVTPLNSSTQTPAKKSPTFDY